MATAAAAAVAKASVCEQQHHIVGDGGEQVQVVLQRSTGTRDKDLFLRTQYLNFRKDFKVSIVNWKPHPNAGDLPNVPEITQWPTKPAVEERQAPPAAAAAAETVTTDAVARMQLLPNSSSSSIIDTSYSGSVSGNVALSVAMSSASATSVTAVAAVPDSANTVATSKTTTVATTSPTQTTDVTTTTFILPEGKYKKVKDRGKRMSIAKNKAMRDRLMKTIDPAKNLSAKDLEQRKRWEIVSEIYIERKRARNATKLALKEEVATWVTTSKEGKATLAVYDQLQEASAAAVAFMTAICPACISIKTLLKAAQYRTTTGKCLLEEKISESLVLKEHMAQPPPPPQQLLDSTDYEACGTAATAANTHDDGVGGVSSTSNSSSSTSCDVALVTAHISSSSSSSAASSSAASSSAPASSSPASFISSLKLAIALYNHALYGSQTAVIVRSDDDCTVKNRFKMLGIELPTCNISNDRAKCVNGFTSVARKLLEVPQERLAILTALHAEAEAAAAAAEKEGEEGQHDNASGGDTCAGSLCCSSSVLKYPSKSAVPTRVIESVVAELAMLRRRGHNRCEEEDEVSKGETQAVVTVSGEEVADTTAVATTTTTVTTTKTQKRRRSKLQLTSAGLEAECAARLVAKSNAFPIRGGAGMIFPNLCTINENLLEALSNETPDEMRRFLDARFDPASYMVDSVMKKLQGAEGYAASIGWGEQGIPERNDLDIALIATVKQSIVPSEQPEYEVKVSYEKNSHDDMNVSMKLDFDACACCKAETNPCENVSISVKRPGVEVSVVANVTLYQRHENSRDRAIPFVFFSSYYGVLQKSELLEISKDMPDGDHISCSQVNLKYVEPPRIEDTFKQLGIDQRSISVMTVDQVLALGATRLCNVAGATVPPLTDGLGFPPVYDQLNRVFAKLPQVLPIMFATLQSFTGQATPKTVLAAVPSPDGIFLLLDDMEPLEESKEKFLRCNLRAADVAPGHYELRHRIAAQCAKLPIQVPDCPAIGIVVPPNFKVDTPQGPMPIWQLF